MIALTAICRHCGKPYEKHAHIGSWCLIGDRFSTTQKFSEDLFTSSGTSRCGDERRVAARAQMVSYETPVTQEMGQRPAVQSDHQTEAEHGFGGKPQTVNDGDLTKTPYSLPDSVLESIQKAPLVTVQDDGFVTEA
jgi:hypothetical protein